MHACRRLTILSVLGATLVCPPPARAAESTAVTDWNSIATSAVLINPGRILDSRALAAVHVAIHDAVNAIERRYEPYLVNTSARGASLDAAVATAAHDVLVKLSTAPNVEPAYVAALAAIPDGPSKTAGIALGKTCADAVLTRLALDGAAAASQPLYVPTASREITSSRRSTHPRRQASSGSSPDGGRSAVGDQAPGSPGAGSRSAAELSVRARRATTSRRLAAWTAPGEPRIRPRLRASGPKARPRDGIASPTP